MTDIFISDLHLSADRQDVFKAFCAFLANLDHEVEQLYILGDLFDVWVGDDAKDHFQNQVKAHLKLLEKRHIRLFVQRGNRDFLYGRRFAKETGAKLLEDYHPYQFGSHRALLMHGDLLCTADIEYQRYRATVHNGLVQALFKLLPILFRRRIGAKIRAKSKASSSAKQRVILDVAPRAVDATCKRFGFSRLVHGHTHRPGVYHAGDSNFRTERMVLGDWDELVWWIERNSEGFSLHSRSLSEQIALSRATV